MKRSLTAAALLLITVLFTACTAQPIQNNDAHKPSVFVIGDSISMHYGPHLEKVLAPDIAYARKTGDPELAKTHYFMKSDNGGTSKRVLDYLVYMFEKPDFKPDLLVVNAGLHDLVISNNKTTHKVPIDQYEKNIQAVIDLAKKHNTKLVWIRTTPINDEIHNAKAEDFKRYNKDVIAYNAVADKLVKQNNIPSIDLYQFTLNLDENLYMDHVHYNDPVRKLQAAYIAGVLNAMNQ